MSAQITGSYSVDLFRSKLILFMKDENIKSAYDLIKELLSMYKVTKDHITKLSFYNIDNEKRTMEASIEYFVITQKEFKAKSKEEQIRFVLKRYGYKNEDIKNIESLASNGNEDEQVWIATIVDKEYVHYCDIVETEGSDPEAKEYEYLENIVDRIKDLLDFDLIIQILPD